MHSQPNDVLLAVTAWVRPTQIWCMRRAAIGIIREQSFLNIHQRLQPAGLLPSRVCCMPLKISIQKRHYLVVYNNLMWFVQVIY